MKISRHLEKPGALTLYAECHLNAPLEDVFAFFADAANLQRLTPPWLHFKILTPLPITMKAGVLIDYRIRLRGFPIRWRSQIDSWEPPHHFVDTQVRGPYHLWEHHHRFSSTQNGTLAVDEVHYRAPFGFMSHSLLVNRDLEKIFAYRQAQMNAVFA
ncbi:MAG: SRPBCC family protein [Myxococcota bacterium]|jgi:ligand-binding SRPBCC domain-containing protein|nr:SRPBCC family protein [Myxococcota bacterium]